MASNYRFIVRAINDVILFLKKGTLKNSRTWITFFNLLSNDFYIMPVSLTNSKDIIANSASVI